MSNQPTSSETIALRLSEIEDRHVPVAEGHWHPLHETFDCECGQIWHTEADKAIFGALMDDPEGQWPEEFISAAARFAAHAQQDVPWLLQQLRQCRAALDMIHAITWQDTDATGEMVSSIAMQGLEGAYPVTEGGST